MDGPILVLNAGSSSLKWALYAQGGEADRRIAFANVEIAGASGEGGTLAARVIDRVLDGVDEALAGARLAGAGHRVVHGGTRFDRPVRISEQVLAALEACVPLAPLHQPQCLAPIRRLMERAPGLAQVACFDTAFHRDAPEIAQRYALPEALHAEGVRRYGFHGLSYESIAASLAALDARAAAGRAIALHLGAGASLCALERGRSVACSMGFSTLEGVPMATRCGSLDPGAVLYLMREKTMDAAAIEALLYHQSGLLGVSGVSGDMRVLLASDDPRARRAVELFVYGTSRELGSLAAALGGVDALVFTGGIGEGSAEIRRRICEAAAWLGVRLSARANRAGGPRIAAARSRVAAWVIATDEEGVIAGHTRRLIAGRQSAA